MIFNSTAEHCNGEDIGAEVEAEPRTNFFPNQQVHFSPFKLDDGATSQHKLSELKVKSSSGYFNDSTLINDSVLGKLN